MLNNNNNSTVHVSRKQDVEWKNQREGLKGKIVPLKETIKGWNSQ